MSVATDTVLGIQRESLLNNPLLMKVSSPNCRLEAPHGNLIETEVTPTLRKLR